MPRVARRGSPSATVESVHNDVHRGHQPAHLIPVALRLISTSDYLPWQSNPDVSQSRHSLTAPSCRYLSMVSRPSPDNISAAMPLSAKPIFSKPKAPSGFPSGEFIPRFTPSQGALICGGCVVIDPALRRVALIHDPSTGINQLPKGRKNIGEDVHAAALRETREETGLHVIPLPLKGLTRATPTAQMLGEPVNDEAFAADPAGEDEDDQDVWEDVDEEGTKAERARGLTGWAHHCEPIGITTYRCEMTLAFKMIFWYAAQADSLQDPRQDTKERWEQQYELKWVGADEAPTHTTFEADGQAIEKALADMRRSGYQI